MTSPQPDAERLAALIDGRLDASEAHALREQLARADQDTIDALMDSMAIARELRAESAPVRLVQPDRTRAVKPRSRWMWSGMLAAASIGFMVISVNSRQTSSPQYPLVAYAASLGTAGATDTETQWSEVRGAGSGGLTDRARAARIGVKLAQLEAGRARKADVVATERAISALIRDLPGQSRAADILSPSTPRTTPVRDDEIQFATQSALNAVDSAMSRSAAYVEFARLAAKDPQSAFFDGYSARDLQALRAHRLLDATMQSAVDSLSAAITTQPRDLSAIARLSAAVLRVLTN